MPKFVYIIIVIALILLLLAIFLISFVKYVKTPSPIKDEKYNACKNCEKREGCSLNIYKCEEEKK